VFSSGKPRAFRLSLVKTLPLRTEGDAIVYELALKLRQRGACIHHLTERGDAYSFEDAAKQLLTFARFGFRRDVYLDSGAKILDALVQTPRFNRWMASIVLPHLGADVLEIGAGIGNLTLQLAPSRASYTATDVDCEHLARLRTRMADRSNIRVEELDVERSEHSRKLSGMFDSVVCLNVLEHVEDDLAGLRNIHATLRRGGNAVILVPQDPTIYGTLDAVLGHYRRYTKDELRSKMEEAGFEVAGILDFNRITRPGWIWNGRILKRNSFGRMQLWIFDRLVWLARRIDPMLPWPSISIIGIGVKR
jgi:2-polyprenyl-3-methyl-5-hydroxy-6-metoxy-1,4-benzoquinol methylase